MAFLETLWDLLGVVFGGIGGSVDRGITKVFGSANARTVTRLQQRADEITALESKYEAMSDDQLRGQTDILRSRLRDGETLDEILVDAFAVCREGAKRFLGMRHYDVQLIGGMVLHGGGIAEMVTGEGKTLVATLPAYLNALEGKGVHVITVNDYLARRDMEWNAPLFLNLGLTIGCIQKDMTTAQKQAAYAKDITYGTNNEFGFDYLRDNMRPAAKGDDRFPPEYQQCQGPLNYAIIDEVDNILIDEARTPLIISGPSDQDPGRYEDADRVARGLTEEEHFTVDEKQHNVTLNEDGVRVAEKLVGVESFYTAGNMEWPHLIDNALKAHHLYKRDVNYLVDGDEVVIVDEHTGRKMEGRQWSDGLHQAVEAKEGVKIKPETQTFATASLQNIFRMYKKLSGMTGTAMTEATEFMKIYGLDTVAIPTHRPLQRIEHADLVYMSEKEKYAALAEEVERAHKWDVVVTKDGEYWGTIVDETDTTVRLEDKDDQSTEEFQKADVTVERKGRPVLIGTVSIEKSERLGRLLDRRGIPHEVLNAKQHKREADIVAQAGQLNAVTIATNMAGRGTDILLGGNPETKAWAQLQHKYPTRLEVPDDEWNTLVKQIDETEQMSVEGKYVREIGGLYVIGTERHESRRIDLQLRGRCGRQGDPGSSRFYLSLEDDLMRIFQGAWVKGMLQRLGMQEGEAIESGMVTRRIAAAQKKVEERNYETRKSLLEYDEVMDEQRKRVYRYRQSLLDGHSSRDMVLDLIRGQIRGAVDTFVDPMYGLDSFAMTVGSALGVEFDPRDFRGMEFEMARDFARDEAKRKVEPDIEEAIDTNIPADAPEEWNWEALAKWANKTQGTNFNVSSIKKMDRDEITTQMIEAAHRRVDAAEFDNAAPMLDEDFGLRMLSAWMRDKFGIETTASEFKDVEDTDHIVDTLMGRAEQAYRHKEHEYPVLTAMSQFTRVEGEIHHLDAAGLAAWVNRRFGRYMHAEDVPTSHDDLLSRLLDHSRESLGPVAEHVEKADAKLDQVFEDADESVSVAVAAGGEDNVEQLAAWIKEELGGTIAPEDLSRMSREEVRLAMSGAIDEKFTPEMRRMERQVLLNVVDDAWKSHLLAMDHLRSSVQLKSYAQLDPKVEYKREGMRLFESMWEAIGGRVTDLIFRMHHLNENFIRSTYVEGVAHHAEAARSVGSASPSADMPGNSREQPIGGRNGSVGTVDGATAANQRAASASAGNDPDEKPAPIRKTGAQVRRNAPCPCGSGKKHKNCCLKKQPSGM